ncbi:MAG: ATP-binding cassette domain-containing protein, partial [Chlorobi bacterium]|nr:ATP-binding cassette domain-containing protein [Chlorobiota bacterium]
ARQVQSRIRMLEKMDRIELESDTGHIRFRFPPPPRPGKVLLTLEQVSKKYGDLEVLENVDFQIDRGDRIAFVGVNGAGKSTLARIIAGTEPVTSGRRVTGHNLVIAYYAQHQADELDPDATPLEVLERSSKEETRAQLRTLLGGFLFQGDDVFKKIRVLSGGERSRVALAKILLSSANLLVMDEPSNHLDIRSKSVLQEALLSYEGSYIIVSHDRDFLQPLVNKVAELASGGIRIFPGSFEDYLEKKHREKQAADSIAENERSGEIRSSQQEKERKREEARKRNERYRKLKPLRDELASVEKRIEELEALKTRLEESLSDEATYKDAERARELNTSYKETTQTLAGLYEEWARIQEGIDAIEREEAER